MESYAGETELTPGAIAAPALRAPRRRAFGMRVERSRAASVAAVVALVLLVLGSLALVLAAAQGGSRYLSPVLHQHGPAWIGGPLDGLWHGRPKSGTWLETALLIDLAVMLLCYGAALAFAKRIRPAVLWGSVVAVHIVFLIGPPLLLTDMFNYILYARMGVLHGMNPYTHLPAQAHFDGVYSLTDWTHMPSAYGPLFTLMTYALVPLGVAGAFWTYKTLLMLVSIGLLVVIWRLARQLGRDPTAAVILCGLNPIVLAFSLGGDHNDVFTMLPVVAAVALMLSGRERAGAASMIVAIGTKASAAVLLPATLLAAGRRRPAFEGAAIAALIVGAATLLAFGPHLPAISEQARLVTEDSLPNLSAYALGLGGETATLRAVWEVIFLAGTVAISVWAWRRRALLEGLGWVTVLFLATLGWDMPWYLVWILPFLALVRSRRFRIAAIITVVWLTVQWLPLVPHTLNSALGIDPAKTLTYCQNEHTMFSMLGQLHKDREIPKERVRDLTPAVLGSPVSHALRVAGSYCVSAMRLTEHKRFSAPPADAVRGTASAPVAQTLNASALK